MKSVVTMVGRYVYSWIQEEAGFLALAGLFLAFTVISPTMAVDRERLPTDSGLVAYLDEVQSRFPRVDGLGDIGVSGGTQLAYDAPRKRLLIADYINDRLLVLNQQGEVAVLANSSTATVPAPWLKDCNDVAVDSSGRIYVADIVNSTVWMIGPDLFWMGAVPVPPVSDGYVRVVAVDSMDRVLVGQYRFFGNSRILVYQEDEKTGSMELVTSFKFNPPGEDYCGRPLDIVVDSQDRIIIAEGSTTYYTAQRVHVFDKEFRWVTTFGSAGSRPGQFTSIGGLAIGPKDAIVVSTPDLHSSTVSFFFSNGTYAGRITGMYYTRGLAFTPGELLIANQLVGGGAVIEHVDVDWTSLHPTETSTTPPGPEPVPESTAAATLILLSWGLAMRSIQAISQRRIGC